VSNSVDLLETLNFISKNMSRQNCSKFKEFNIKFSSYGKLNIQEKQLPILLLQNVRKDEIYLQLGAN
jgi:hypothetical protein